MAPEDNFASDSARDLAAQHPDVDFPAQGSSSAGKLTVDDVRSAVASSTPSTSSTSDDETPEHVEHVASARRAVQVIAHGYPTLTSGSDGPAVVELGTLLGELGYESSVSRGENPFSVLDGSVLAAVQEFRREHDVPVEDGFPSETIAANHVGPQTWEALLGATG